MVAAAISRRLTAGRESAGKETYGFVRRVALGKPLPGLRQKTGESRILTCTAQIEGAAAGRLILDAPRVAGVPEGIAFFTRRHVRLRSGLLPDFPWWAQNVGRASFDACPD